MMDINSIRLFALWGVSALGWAIVITLITAFVSGGRSVRVTHLPLAAATVFQLAVFAFLLAISTKAYPLISRTQLLPINTALEFGSMLLGWSWYLLSVSNSFCIKRRNQTGEC